MITAGYICTCSGCSAVRLARQLRELEVAGSNPVGRAIINPVNSVETNLDFQYQIMKNQVFCDGKADTGFIENVLKIKGDRKSVV